MCFFDSRVCECPIWQVVLIRVVKVGVEVDMMVLRRNAIMVELELNVELTKLLKQNLELIILDSYNSGELYTQLCSDKKSMIITK